ncbi:hypothetical protein GGI07_002330 [Coemansia sp. Benny D115]|nr:hypothetical protein GGI07_002330 [Coemansia sp. Benny D115]
MKEILNSLIDRLGLSDVPGLPGKATQFFHTICSRIPNPKNNRLSLCRQAIAIQLASESLTTDFNKQAASSMSAVNLPDYLACLQEVRIALGLIKSITLEELDVQFSPVPGTIEMARALLEEFREGFSATMPVNLTRSMNWSDSVYIVAAYYVVCRHAKKRSASQPTLIKMALTRKDAFAKAVSALETYGQNTIKAIKERGLLEASSVLNKSADRSVASQKKRAQRRATMAVVPETAPVDEAILVTGRKRTRRPSVPDTTTVTRRTRARRAPEGSAEPETTAKSAATPKQKPINVAQRKSKQVVEKQPKLNNERRPRIGVVSMVQDRDYRETALYANYMVWKENMLQA